MFCVVCCALSIACRCCVVELDTEYEAHRRSPCQIRAEGGSGGSDLLVVRAVHAEPVAHIRRGHRELNRHDEVLLRGNGVLAVVVVVVVVVIVVVVVVVVVVRTCDVCV